MDVDFARTFLTILETGSFASASKRLNVTQSTVSARIKALEDQLGSPVFQRFKTGVLPTPAGARFERHAQAMVRAWSQARQEAGLSEKFTARLNIGGQITYWDSLLLNWVSWARATLPALAIRAEMGTNESLMREMADGLLDAAVLYTPQRINGLHAERLFEDELIMVGTDPDCRGPADRNYVFVDWGADFRTDHARRFPDIAAPALYFGVGTVALSFILSQGGSGYFPARMVSDAIRAGTLFRISDAAAFHRAAYLVTAEILPEGLLADALEGLRRMACTLVPPSFEPSGAPFGGGQVLPSPAAAAMMAAEGQPNSV